jgi:hypothetical protein
MGTLALDRNWDIRIEPSDAESDAFSPVINYPINTKKTIKITSDCDTISQSIKQSILNQDLSRFVGSNVSTEFLSGVVKSAIYDVNGVNSIIQFSIAKTNRSGLFGGISISFTVDTSCGRVSSTIG